MSKHPYGRRYSASLLAERNYHDIRVAKARRTVTTILLCVVWFLAGFISCFLWLN